MEASKPSRRVFIPWAISEAPPFKIKPKPACKKIAEMEARRKLIAMELPATTSSDLMPNTMSSPSEKDLFEVEKPQEVLDNDSMEQASAFPYTYDDISMSFGKNDNRVNRCLNVSLVSLGQLDLNSTLAALPEWVFAVQRKRSLEPSQIKAKVEYKVAAKVNGQGPQSNCTEKRMMPEPEAHTYEKKIRIQDTDEKTHKIRNWCLGFSSSGSAIIQGYDVMKQKNIRSTDIVAIKNQREILTTRSTYILVGNLDKRKWSKNLPSQSERYFSDGFPDDWRSVVKIVRKHMETGNQDIESDSENRARILKDIGPSARLNRKRLEAKSTLMDVPEEEEHSKSTENVQIIRLENWSVIVSGRGKDAKFKLADTVANAYGRIETKFEVSLDQIVKKNSLCFVSKDKTTEYQLIGFGIFDESTPEFVRQQFADGFPQHYELYLEKWRDYEMSKFTELTATRSGRCLKPTEKKAALLNQCNIEKMIEKKVTKKEIFKVPNVIQKPVELRTQAPKQSASELSSDDDIDMSKAKGNTKKAQKARSGIKERLKESATFTDNDFFFQAGDIESQTDDDFPATMKTPTQKVKRAKKVMSPMASFLASQTEEEMQQDSGSDGDEDEAGMKDKRKKKAVEKFVYNEKMQKLKRKVPQVSVAPKKLPKVKSRVQELQLMQHFLDKNLEKRKKTDQKLIYGEDPDLSDLSD